jgi:hypothetical protein
LHSFKLRINSFLFLKNMTPVIDPRTRYFPLEGTDPDGDLI